MQPEPIFIEPVLLPIPDVPKDVVEEPVPKFEPPPAPDMLEPELPALVLPEEPCMPPEPPAFSQGVPEWGEDWSGERPHFTRLPIFYAPEPEEEPVWICPPAREMPLELVRVLQ